MIRIIKLEQLIGFLIRVHFNDDSIKDFDFSELIRFDSDLTKNFKDQSFFKQVVIINNGRGIMWPNEYDCCADWLRYYANDIKKEWKNVNDDTPLDKRIEMVSKKLVS